ncbi:Transcriptional regulator, PadR family [Alteracholeplasma palmae J233]|uniref:Transcriptional regulator, PadR family n=1 Tax=Alteracholeplasma palmae (strain ATCC 49389 / J233) TaxID=1318466 RepID=U4KJU6_ALTPJ|nr:PadR family transcriptional regulator [Alteracholeplasma palmae]CCV63718.1 Transcriptional regulator, PadR family [Alteracholeplasma palmae J233]
METQLKRGVIEIYVLAQLRKKESYGYEIVSTLSKYIEISESTLYPILRRLEVADELETYSVIHNGRNRKYYKITKKGIKHIEEFLDAWQDIIQTYDQISNDYEEVK